ncbi:MAG TPA: hypothetical protein DCW90_08970 [Lachnospiraceae bacterium]|nr:cyclic lactone autoinducer peptide [uncultured Lachnoclostridium sp.]HAU85617.1 hypothetical protein [Lachnospiraceae bacterium]
MKRLEQVAVKVARKITEQNVDQSVCFFFFYQPKINQNLKKRLRETR